MMPGLTGIEVCRKVRGNAREPYTYLLLLTGKTTRKTPWRAWIPGRTTIS